VRFIGAHSHAGFALVVFQPGVIKGTNGVCQIYEEVLEFFRAAAGQPSMSNQPFLELTA
jgi:hypothetical protein